MQKTLKVSSVDKFIFGTAPQPVVCGRGVSIGSGTVIPEINFTLPPMLISDATWPEVLNQYGEIIDGVLERAVRLAVPALLVEFETLPDMTRRPEWGLEITRLLADQMQTAYEQHGLKNALRLTINDIREFNRPPLLRRGSNWENMVKFLESSAQAGADMIAIESTGGKEICDEALVACDIRTVAFALGVLGSRDMEFLWRHIVSCCERLKIVASGDSACGFANTAMVLAEQNMIPRVFAALVRVASVPRSLVAMEMGAVGPSKDCAYEGPYLKAIAGVPISMEGKSAACAHLSSIGNISQALCDCWSNESVQNIRMLSANAPVVSMEQLAYDCRLMNTAAGHSNGDTVRLRDWLCESDSSRDPQAYVLRPDIVIEISRQIIKQETAYQRTRAALVTAAELLKKGFEQKQLHISDRELKWLDRLQGEIADLPVDENVLVDEMLQRSDLNGKFLPEEYGL